MPSDRSLCIVDQSLKDQVGHFYEYAHCLYQCARNRGDRFVVLGHREASAAQLGDLPVEPIFRLSFFDQFGRQSRVAPQLDPLRSNLSFYTDLKAALRRRADASWVLFMPTLCHNELLGWAWWLARRPAAAAPSVVLLIRGSYYFDYASQQWNHLARWARLGFRALERVAARRPLRIAVDSDCLQSLYRRLTRLPVEVFPIPHTRPGSPGGGRFARAGGAARVRMVLPGGARSEKGFVALAEALRQLAPDLEAGSLEVALQCNISGDPPALRAREQLEEWRLPNVSLLKEPLNAADYYSLLDSSDVVLIPYRSGDYWARTSGILAEAFAAGKPVVTTAATWMAGQVEQGGGGVLCRDEDPADLARAMREARDRLPDLRAEVAARLAAWVAFHNPDTLYRMVMDGGCR
ncbi:MAG: glycosyltransferase [Armatimonadetes bacterium]|nr:glycosyltransferase [Armatimonadota bacterium]